ncbi:LamG domain-containing protein [Candidatus Poribacteria bacterium]
MVRIILVSVCVLVLLLSAWGAMAADLEDGLILHLAFEKEDPVDLSPDPADVSVAKGALKLANGKVGQAAEFDGSTILEVTHADKLDGMEALTIAAWIQPEKVTEASIVSKRIANVNADSYNFFMWTGNKLDGRINASGDFWSTTVIQAGTWYHVAYVYDGPAQQQRIYVDGALDAEGVQLNQVVPQNDSPLWIGELDSARGFIYIGLMDELGIWNRALSEEEIKLTMEGIVMAVEPQSKLTTTWGDMKR